MVFSLSREIADRLFPFHLLLDRELRVRHVAPVIGRLLPALTPGTVLTEVLETVRPTTPLSPETAEALADTLLILRTRHPPELLLKGQITPDASGTGMVLLVSPRIIDGDEMKRLGLTAADFALHDPISETMLVLQAMRASLADAELLAQRLRRARDEALQASRAKSQFLANMSHELRTPLNAVLGFSDIMQAQVFGDLPPRYLGYVKDIHFSARHLLDLIGDLLDLARIEAERYELHPAEISLLEIAEDCARTVSPQAQHRQVSVRIDAPASEQTVVFADERAIRQILLNLLSNAVKFGKREGTVQITLRRLDAGLRVAVTDDGPGVDPASIPFLFEPFRQGDNIHISRRRDGAGLGLHIARELAKLHGGSLEMESRPGTGTTVSLTLPLGRTGTEPQAS